MDLPVLIEYCWACNFEVKRFTSAVALAAVRTTRALLRFATRRSHLWGTGMVDKREAALAEEEVERLYRRIALLEAIRNMVTIVLPVILAGALWIFRAEIAGLSTIFHVTIVTTLAAILVLLLELEIQMFKAELRELIREIEHSFWVA